MLELTNEQQQLLKKKAQQVLASRNLWAYCRLKSLEFYNSNALYLKEICDAIEDFENNDVELLVINMPPRHGKSRTATNATQWLLGRNPSYKIMTCSYNEKLSTKFSRQVRDSILERQTINTIVFRDIFPKVSIKRGNSSVGMWALDGNAEENYLATSPGATTTGIGADFIIIDDIVKNKYEACNAHILEEHWNWFTDTLYSRLEGKRKILIFMTRWATKDLAGRLISLFEKQDRRYKLISKKACDNSIVENKVIVKGNMLNDNILNLKQYNNLINTIGEDIVRANYDQQPIDLKGVLYTELLVYESLQNVIFTNIQAHCDTADTGNDYLCNIIYGITEDKKAYILDIYYTQDSMEVTELEVAKRLTEYNVAIFKPESNNGGRGFSRAVERKARELHNNTTLFRPYTQTLNKQARILSNATTVMLNIYFPKDWNKLYPKFHQDITEYQKQGKNAHDDAPDTITAIAEELQGKRKSTYIFG